MSTNESPMVVKLWDEIHQVNKLAVNSGSVGDAAHMAETHTYHVSYADQVHNDGYSVHYYGDKHELSGEHATWGDVTDLACAQDISFKDGYLLHGAAITKDHYDKLSLDDRHKAKAVTPPELMIKYTARLHHWAASGKRSIHLIGVREFAGTLNGSDVFAMDTTHDPVETYGWDDSHLWHIHISIDRRLINSPHILTIAKIFA